MSRSDKKVITVTLFIMLAILIVGTGNNADICVVDVASEVCNG